MISSIRCLTRDERGATLVEYGVLLMLVALAAIVAITVFGGAVSNMYTNASSDV